MVILTHGIRTKYTHRDAVSGIFGHFSMFDVDKHHCSHCARRGALFSSLVMAERQIIHEHKTENFNDYTPTQNYCLQLYSCFAPSNLEELLLKYLAWKKPSICLLVINEIVI